MAIIGTLVIGMRVKTDQLKAGLKSAGSEVQSFVKQTASLKGALGGLLVGAGAYELGAQFVHAAKAASDLKEQTSKADQVFGDFSSGVRKSAEDMADAFGVPKKEFLDSASSIGLIAKATGLSQRAAADMGVNFAKLALDVSSLNNVPLEDALAAIRSGLVGEAEPMRRFGVLLNEDAVKAEALRLGLAKTGKEISEGAKVQARASLITRGLSDAQGDLARTASGAANQARSFAGRLENAYADVGDAIEPLTDQFLHLANAGVAVLTEKIRENRAEVKQWAADAGQGNGVVFDSFSSVASAVGLVLDVLHYSKLGFQGWQLLVTGQIGLVVKAFSYLATVADKILQLTTGKTTGIGQFARTMAEEFDAVNKKQVEGFAQEFNKGRPSEEIARFLEDVQAKMRGVGKAAADAKGGVAGLNGAMGAGGAPAAKMAEKVEELLKHLHEEVATFKQSSAEKELYKLKTMGATEAQVAEAQALSATLKQMEAARKDREKMKGDAEEAFLSTRSPVELFRGEMAKLNMLKQAGMIDQDTFDRSRNKAATDLLSEGKGSREARFSAAAEAGSKEARSSLLQFRNGYGVGDPLREIQRLNQQALQEQKRQTALSGRIAAALERPVQPVL